MNKDFAMESGQKFISNVLGGAGAVWGSSEIVYLRNQNNKLLWRGIAGSAGVIFFGIRWISRIRGFVGLRITRSSSVQGHPERWGSGLWR